MTDEETSELWASFLSGDERAYAGLFQMYYADLYRYGLHLVPGEEFVRDAIQDTFLYLYTRRHKLDREVGDVRAYLFVAFRRKLLANRKRLNRDVNRQTDRKQPEFSVDAEHILIEEESARINQELVARQLNELPARQREILYLRFYQGQSMPQIADTLALTYQTVANHLHRGLKRLRSNDQLRGLFKTALLFLSDHLSS
jgi:RNA polymerase sigma factor (sigma-70 family)